MALPASGHPRKHFPLEPGPVWSAVISSRLPRLPLPPRHANIHQHARLAFQLCPFRPNTSPVRILIAVDGSGGGKPTRAIVIFMQAADGIISIIGVELLQ